MALYEQRTYHAVVGKMSEIVALYTAVGWPLLEKHADKLVGYFLGDVGGMNQLIHIWKFKDDADRRAFWAAFYGDQDLMEFAFKLRPLLSSQENKLLIGAPWGPKP
jgi:hypothetical protein